MTEEDPVCRTEYDTVAFYEQHCQTTFLKRPANKFLGRTASRFPRRAARKETCRTGQIFTNTATLILEFQGFSIEFMITLVLVMVIFASASDANNKDYVKGSAPLVIGLSITTCHLFAIHLTGSIMNPARSLGPSLVMGCWDNHWVYWACPILRGISAGFLYQLVFQVSYWAK